MAGEEQYYSPIIQAMIASQRTMQDKANLAERTRAAKVDENHRQQQLDQLTKYQDKQLEIEQQAHDAEAEWRKAQAARELAQDKMNALELVHKGYPAQVIPSIIQGAKYNPGQQGTGGPGVMGQSVAPSLNIGGQDIPTDLLPTPQKEAALKLKEAEDALRSKLTIEEPYNIRSDARKLAGQKEVAQIGYDKAIDQSNVRADTQKEIEKGRESTQRELQNMRDTINMFRLMAPGGAFGTSDDAINSYMSGIFGTGGVRLTDVGEKLRPSLMAAAGKKGLNKPVDKKDIQGLKDLDALDDIFNRFEEVAKMLPSGGKGLIGGLIGKGKALGTGILANTKISTELKTKIQEIQSDMQNVAKRLEGFSGARPLLGLYQAEKGSVPGEFDTMENALDKVRNLRERRDQGKREFFKGFSPQQAQFISDLNDISLPKSAAKRKVYNPQTNTFEEK